MADKTGRFAMIEQFVADGISYMFGNPGTVEQGFLDALLDYPDFRYIETLQESIAVGIADGYARATMEPTVVQLHTGVGLGNGIGMIYQAKRGNAPLVVIAGESGVQYDAFDAQMAADLVAMAKPVTKWATRIIDPSSTLRVLRRAIKIASTPPTGPVFVSLPMDVLDAPCVEEVHPTSRLVTRVAPTTDDVRAAADLLAGGANPLVIMGDGVTFSGAQAELTRVAELLGAEVWGANSSEVNIDQTHPLFRGLTGHMFGETSQKITFDNDRVLVVGTYVFPEVFPTLGNLFPTDARIVHIDLDAYEIAKNYKVDLGLVADPKLSLAALADALEQRLGDADREAGRQRLADYTELKQREDAAAKARDDERAGDVPMGMEPFARELAARISDDALIFDEALTSSPGLTRYLPPRTPGTYFQTRGGSLGVGIPGAIGLKLAHPDREVWGFTGDGGSMYTPQALWTAAHHRVNAKFVVCNNHSYQLLKLNLQAYWDERDLPERPFPASFDIGDPDIDFVRLAESLGVGGARVERPDQVAAAIEQARAHDGPFLIDLVVAQNVPGR